jgi:aminomethyltransferase
MVSLTVSPRIRKSPFFASTVRAGVTDFTVYNKMLMPTSYGDLTAEYRRLIEGVAIWDVACERQVEVSGPDAHDLVQYLTARNLTGMVEGQGKYVAMCDHEGRLLNDPVLLKLTDRYWFSLADYDMLLWCKAVAFERGFDVTVTEPDVSPLAVQGPLAVEVVASLCGDWVRDLKYFWFRATDIDGIPVVVCRSGWSKQGGYELFLQDGAEGDRLWDLVVTAGAPHGIGPGAPNHVERVESGLLSWGGDTTPDSNPFEANMGSYVDVDCEPDYVGKAALAAVAARGPRRRFTGLVIEGDASTAWPLEARFPLTVDGEPVGTMSAVVFSPRLAKTIGLGQVNTDMMDRRLKVDAPAGTFDVTTHPLPFI